MYLSFYNLQRKPFQISTDPKFLWLGEKHKEALATLRYGILDNKGFLLLTGDVGTGKTTLIHTLLRTLGKDILVASIRDPALDPIDFFNYTAHAFGMNQTFTSKGAFLIQFERFLHDANGANKKVLLIIDESQRIDQKLLEEVRLLSNIEKEDNKLLNIFFVGQIEFNNIILQPENAAIRQRITINYTIETLSEVETKKYIRHRLEVAGAKKNFDSSKIIHEDLNGNDTEHDFELSESIGELFTAEAIQEIYNYSKGYPRLINIICDRSLLTGFVEESALITGNHVRECAKELEIPQLKENLNIIEESPSEQEAAGAPLAQNEVPVGYTYNKELNNNNRSRTRSIRWPVGMLLLIVLFFLGLSITGAIYKSDYTISAYVQDFLQQAKNQPEVTKTNTVDIKTFQSESAQKNDQKHLTQEETDAGRSLHNIEVGLSKEEKKLDTDEPAGIDSTSPKPILKNTQQKMVEKNDQSVDIPGEKSEEIVPYNSVSGVTLNDSFQEEKKINETEISIKQEKTLTSHISFEKLVIPFPSNSSFPPVHSLDSLNMLVESLLPQPSYKITVTGFSDNQGNKTFNKKLSEFRADTVKGYLVGKGLESTQITTLGLGALHPIEPNDTPAGRQANRRVEIVIDQ